MASRHCSDPLGQCFPALSSTLTAWQAREHVRISVFLARSVLEGDVVRVNHLYPHSLASSLKWLVRPLGKGSEVLGHGNVVRLLVSSVTAQRACNACGPLYLRTRGRGCRPSGFDPSCLCPKCRAPGEPNTSLLSFTRFCSPYHRPLASGPQAHVRPQEKKSVRCCRIESHNDSKFIARKASFYRPKLALIGK